jgi:steroid delta-isomerase-like uncharacterized protein
MPDESRDLVRRFFVAVAEDDEAALDELIAADASDHTPFPGQAPGVEGVKQIFRMLRTGFPDFRQEVREVIAEGDRVAVRSKLRGTHRGEFLGIPATGRAVEVESIDIMRIADGRFVEHWGLIDQMGLISQLGEMPPR